MHTPGGNPHGFPLGDGVGTGGTDGKVFELKGGTVVHDFPCSPGVSGSGCADGQDHTRCCCRVHPVLEDAFMEQWSTGECKPDHYVATGDHGLNASDPLLDLTPEEYAEEEERQDELARQDVIAAAAQEAIERKASEDLARAAARAAANAAVAEAVADAASTQNASSTNGSSAMERVELFNSTYSASFSKWSWNRTAFAEAWAQKSNVSRTEYVLNTYVCNAIDADWGLDGVQMAFEMNLFGVKGVSPSLEASAYLWDSKNEFSFLHIGGDVERADSGFEMWMRTRVGDLRLGGSSAEYTDRLVDAINFALARSALVPRMAYGDMNDPRRITHTQVRAIASWLVQYSGTSDVARALQDQWRLSTCKSPTHAPVRTEVQNYTSPSCLPLQNGSFVDEATLVHHTERPLYAGLGVPEVTTNTTTFSKRRTCSAFNVSEPWIKYDPEVQSLSLRIEGLHNVTNDPLGAGEDRFGRNSTRRHLESAQLLAQEQARVHFSLVGTQDGSTLESTESFRLTPTQRR